MSRDIEVKAWEHEQQARLDEAGVEFASTLRRAGFQLGLDYERLTTSSCVQAIYVGPIYSTVTAWSLTFLAACLAPDGYRHVGLDAFDEESSGRRVHWLILAKYDGTIVETMQPSEFAWCSSMPE